MKLKFRVSDKRVSNDSGTARPTLLRLLLKDKLPLWARVLISLAVILLVLFFIRVIL